MNYLKFANFLARNSCPRWNRMRVVRKICRTGYRMMGRIAILRAKPGMMPFFLMRPPKKVEHAVKVAPFDKWNTYPWPYRDPRFADWEEDDSLEGYNLISDPAGFVVRRSTSYCAWKIYEATGRWPKNHGNSGRRRFDAKNWEELLGLNYFNRIEIEDAILQPGYCYIGIIPEQGEFGQVVHLEKVYIHFEDGVQQEDYRVSTYEDFQYKEYWMSGQEAHEMTWMMTSRFNIPPRGWGKVKQKFYEVKRCLRKEFAN